MTDYRAPALSRGLRVLEYLSASGVPMTMGEISLALSLSFNHLFRIIQCLEEEGYLKQDARRYYHLTDKLTLTGQYRYIEQLAQSERCQQLMKDFTWRTNQPCHLAGLRDDRVVVIAHRHPDFTPAISAREGALLHTIRSSSSLVLLAFASDQDSWRLIRHYALDTALRGEMVEQLSRIKSQGFAEIPHDRIIGLTSASWPIFGPDSYAHAVITCPWFDQLPGDYEETKQALGEMAEALGDALSALMRSRC